MTRVPATTADAGKPSPPVVPLGPQPPAPSHATGARAAPAPARPHPEPSSPIQTTPNAREQPAEAVTTSFASHATVARSRLTRTVLLVALAVLGTGGGVVAVTGALSSGVRTDRHSPRVTTEEGKPAPVPSAVGPSAGEQSGDRGEIVSLLDRYQSAYSRHEAPALARLFAAQIVRHGLAAGGCTVSHGRSAVLASYESQFRDGSGSYRLVGLAAEQVQLDSKTQAHLDGHYRITPGGSGYVNFRFIDTGEGWRISEVDATCS